MTELEKLCENALYEEIRVLEDGKSVVRDAPTGRLYFKKTLDVYNRQVFDYIQNHKNRHVPAVEACWMDGDKLVVIEELIQGKTLDEILSGAEGAGRAEVDGGDGKELRADGGDGKNSEAGSSEEGLSFAEKIDILTQICDGLEFLHKADPPIIHRDIKASNIMVTDDGIVKIIDYDAAKIYVNGQKRDTVMIGTQGLAAPEQYGFAQSDVRTDLYALGKLIERMLPDNVDAVRIAGKATEMDPKKRYTSAAQMKTQIQRIREKPAFLDRKFEKIPGFDPMNKSHRIRARIALAAAALAAVLFAVVLGWRFLVYPVQQEEAIRTEMAAIEKTKANEDQVPRAVEVFVAAHDYNRMSAGQKQIVRDGMVSTIERCCEAGMTGNAQEIRDILTKYYGDEALWEAVYTYGKAGAVLSRNQFGDGLGALHDCRENGAADAEKYWESGVEKTLQAARDNMESFRKSENVQYLPVIANAFATLEKYDAGTDEEFQSVYVEILAIAAENRKSKNWENASRIYQALLDAGAGDTDELAELVKESGYEEAESAFAGHDYQSAQSKYSALGDYKDAAEKAKESMYRKGITEFENGSYEKSASSFASVAGYKDADSRAQDARYRYCEKSAEAPTSTTYTYISLLLDEGYEGAEDLRDEIYKWRATISTSMAYSFGPMQSAHIKATLRGGPPDATTTVTFRIDDLTRGDSDTYTDGKEYKNGDVATVDYSEEENSYDLFDGSYIIRIYGDGGELIGSYEGELSRAF